MTVVHAQTSVSDVALTLAAGRPVTKVWANGKGGVTWRVLGPTRTTFLKVGPRHTQFSARNDVERLTWVGRYIAAPRPIAHGTIGDFDWIESESLPGHSSLIFGIGLNPRFVGSQKRLAHALGCALRHFHDRLPVESCPFTWGAEERLARTPISLREDLQQTPALDAVVCHGDATNSNFLFDDDLRCVGYVDLGRLGVADRWADIAPAILSLGWNLGPDLEQDYLDGYGIGLDAEKFGYYSALWDAEDAPPDRSLASSVDVGSSLAD